MSEIATAMNIMAVSSLICALTTFLWFFFNVWMEYNKAKEITKAKDQLDSVVTNISPLIPRLEELLKETLPSVPQAQQKVTERFDRFLQDIGERVEKAFQDGVERLEGLSKQLENLKLEPKEHGPYEIAEPEAEVVTEEPWRDRHPERHA